MILYKPYKDKSKSWSGPSEGRDDAVITLQELSAKTGVSRNWIYSVLLPDIHNVSYQVATKNLNTGDEREMPDVRVCFLKSEIAGWFKTHAVYTQQQTHGDLCVITGLALPALEKQIDDARERLAIEKHVSERKAMQTKWYQLIEFAPYEKYFPGNNRTRTLYPEVPIEPVDIFDGKYHLIPSNQDKRTKELLYREMFDRGAVKVSLGSRKTLFLVCDPPKEYQYPIYYPITCHKDNYQQRH